MRIVLTFLAAILLVSCIPTNYYNQTVSSWQGGNINTLRQNWGAPDQKTTTLTGNNVYIYKTQNYRSFNSPANPQVGVNYSGRNRPVIYNEPNTNEAWNRGASTLHCLAAFEFNAKGVIVNTQVQGTGCYGSEQFARKKANPLAPVALPNQG